MQFKLGLVVLSAMASLVLFSGNAVEAKSAETDTNAVKTEAKVATPAPVMVTVKLGDTLSSIADTHKTTYKRIFNANASIVNPDIIDVDDTVRIPRADEVLTDRPLPANIVLPAAQASNLPTAAAAASAPAGGEVTMRRGTAMGSVAGNGYVWGNCTWYVKNRRPDLPNNLGNGGSWVANAASMGLATGSKPVAGAVGEQPGHVVYVESVNANGTVNISEMNYNGGLGQVHYRTAPASNFRYIY